MPHPWVEHCLHIHVADLSHRLRRLQEFPAADHARIFLSRHEQHRHPRIPRPPSPHIVCVLHQRKKPDEAVESEAEIAQRIRIVPSDDLRISTYPCMRRFFASEPPVERAECEIFKQRRPVPVPCDGRKRLAKHLRCPDPGIQARTSAHHQSCIPLIAAPDACPHRKRSHAMPEKHDRQLRIFPLRQLRHLPHILHKPVPSAFHEMSEVRRCPDRLPMPPVVMYHTHKSFPRQKLHEPLIPLLMLAHPVHQLHHSPRPFFRFACHHPDLKPVRSGHYACLSEFRCHFPAIFVFKNIY